MLYIHYNYTIKTSNACRKFAYEPAYVTFRYSTISALSNIWTPVFGSSM
jgi:hypothetical protein